jgi:hypothetical protein
VDREPFVFGKGWVHSADLMYFYGATSEMNEADEFESVVLRRQGNEWGLWQVATRLCSVVTADNRGERVVVCTGIDGYVEIGERPEAIDNAEDGPNELRHITFVRPFGQRILAVGMSRMVYERDVAAGPWRRMDDGIRIPRQSLEIDGLKSIDGDGRGNYVAVGLRGGIWIYRNGRWHSIASPTNVKLESVRWIDDVIYAAGGGGLLFRGRPDALELVEQTATDETFWSIESYRHELYLATRSNSLWRLVGDDLVPVELPRTPPVTTGWLHANDGVLLSVGERDLALYDGEAWRRLKPPPEDVAWPFEW